MNKFLIVVAGAFLFGTMAGAAAAGAADETATENRVIDARITRVRLDGVVDLKVRQGAVPSLVISGNTRLVGQTISRQNGDTLIIENDEHSGRSGRRSSLRVELVLPALRELVSESLGRSDVGSDAGVDW